jgi:arsenite methyltransferase
MQNNTRDEQVREQVRQGYGGIAANTGSSCCGGGPSKAKTRTLALEIGYSSAELAAIPEEANLGLGCGNPTAIAALEPGEVVVDLGSGAGMDAFLAAQQVTPTGRVIGIDMTPEMLTRAREAAAKRGMAGYVEFREGIIEDIPVVSESVDVVISNCVINLSPQKEQVFREAFRILKSGGRLAVSDICLSKPLPPAVLEQAEVYVACIGGAMLADDYLAAMKAAGFEDVKWTRSSAAVIFEGACCDATIEGALESLDDTTRQEILDSIWSYKVEARKP